MNISSHEYDDWVMDNSAMLENALGPEGNKHINLTGFFDEEICRAVLSERLSAEAIKATDHKRADGSEVQQNYLVSVIQGRRAIEELDGATGLYLQNVRQLVASLGLIFPGVETWNPTRVQLNDYRYRDSDSTERISPHRDFARYGGLIAVGLLREGGFCGYINADGTREETQEKIGDLSLLAAPGLYDFDPISIRAEHYVEAEQGSERAVVHISDELFSNPTI